MNFTICLIVPTKMSKDCVCVCVFPLEDTLSPRNPVKVYVTGSIRREVVVQLLGIQLLVIIQRSNNTNYLEHSLIIMYLF